MGSDECCEGKPPPCWETGAALGQLRALVFTPFQLTLGAPLPLGALGMLEPTLPGFPGLGKGLGVGLAGLVVVSTGVSK